MSEWRDVTVQEIAAPNKYALATGPFGSAISARFFTKSGVPVIRGSNLSLNVGERLIDAGLAFISPELAEKFERSAARVGDLIFTCWGTIGQVGLVDGRSAYGHYIVSNKQMKLTPNQDLTSPLFLYYAFSETSFVKRLQNISIGSSVPGFNLGQLKSLPLRLPPLGVQQGIAAVLGGLDDKIAVNDRIAVASDDLVRTHYSRESLGTRDSVNIGDLGILVRDAVNPASLTSEENYIALEHIPRRNMWLSNWDSSSGVISTKNRFLPGDVLFGKLRPYFHKVGIAFVDGVASTDIFVVRPRVDDHRGWLLAALASDEVVAHASATGDGTRMPRTGWRDLANYEIPWIGPGRAAEFNEVVTSLMNRVSAAVRESKTLSSIRDTLLPKLVSGDVRVRDAERIVEDVT